MSSTAQCQQDIPKIVFPPEQYICFLHDDIDFGWPKTGVAAFIEAWNAGTSIVDIAHKFDRAEDEALILALSLAREGRLQPRKGGIWG